MLLSLLDIFIGKRSSDTSLNKPLLNKVSGGEEPACEFNESDKSCAFVIYYFPTY